VIVHKIHPESVEGKFISFLIGYKKLILSWTTIIIKEKKVVNGKKEKVKKEGRKKKKGKIERKKFVCENYRKENKNIVNRIERTVIYSELRSFGAGSKQMDSTKFKKPVLVSRISIIIFVSSFTHSLIKWNDILWRQR